MCKVITVTNRILCGEDFLERIRVLCRAGVDAIVLREKELPEWEYEELAGKVISICKEFPVEFIYHQNVQVARKAGRSNIHLPVPLLAEYRGELPGFKQVGTSVHSVEQLRIAEGLEVDYVFYGHVFKTDCKKGVPPRGLSALEEICKKANLPVYAIGGISPENVELVAKAGAAGVCVMSWGMQQSEAMIREFVKKCHRL